MSAKNSKSFCTDSLMLKVWGCLVGDFRSVCGEALGRFHEDFIREGNLKDYRLRNWPSKANESRASFKRMYQLENLFKRYRFTQDAYTTAELQQVTDEKFVATQERLNMALPNSCTVRAVLSRARSFAKKILGEYDEEEHMSLCRFGKRASVGSPKQRSRLDQKLQDNPLTGSAQHISWFTKRYLPTDPLLRSILQQRPKGPMLEMCDTLTNTNVPKSWKSLRSIMPNTLVGGFYTYGLGKMLQNRLKGCGLNLKTLQSEHKILAQISSTSRKLTTADLSAASDSFTSALLNAILPRKWFNVVKYGRVPNVKVGDSVMHMNSFMGMGIGFTFTTQTLVFYCLLKAIADLLGISGTISVYGDDLIYPSSMHRYVSIIFPALGFNLNMDKTFCEEFFRESCGGDYYRGTDVRPFQPEGCGRLVRRTEYLGLIYKTINGLLRRWDRTEINMTLEYLYKEVLRCSDSIFQVPPGYPDYSGIVVSNPEDGPWHLPLSRVWYSRTSCCFGFRCLSQTKGKERIVTVQHSFYWDTVRSASVGADSELPCLPAHMAIKRYLQLYGRFVREAVEPILSWVRAVPYKVVRSKDGWRLRRLQAVVYSEELSSLTVVSDTTSMWTKGVR